MASTSASRGAQPYCRNLNLFGAIARPNTATGFFLDLLLWDELDLEFDVDLVADEQSVQAEWGVEVNPEVRAPDLASGTKAGPGVSVVIDSHAMEIHVELNRHCGSLDGEFSDQCARSHDRALEGHLWMGFNVEEVTGLEVAVPLGVVGVY